MKEPNDVKVAIAGLGNCATALIRLIEAIRQGKDIKGVRLQTLGGINIPQIRFVAAFDVNKEKIGKDISEAISLNTTQNICDIPYMGVRVSPGPILDGVAPHMREFFCPDENIQVDEEFVVDILRKSGAEVLLNYVPVGSEKASVFYAKCALKAGVAFINCMPSEIPFSLVEEFKEKKIPYIGNDIKSGVGASILNRDIAHLLDLRGAEILEIEQRNRGWNTDFLNMQPDSKDPDRMKTKWRSKRYTVESNIGNQKPRFDLICNGLDSALLPDHKVCDLKFRAIVCGTQLDIDARLEVVDSYNSAAVVVDAIRVAIIAMRRGIGGFIIPACAFFMKSPPVQMNDDQAAIELERFVNDNSRTIIISHSRIKAVTQSGDKYSEVWSGIYDQFSKLEGVEFWSIENHYHDEKEFFELIKKALEELSSYASGYERNLVIPFSITNVGLKKKLIALLKEHPEINLFGINVPPSEEYLSALPNIYGYIGMDEVEVGRKLYQELVSRAPISKILVLHHEKNQGLVMRANGIKELAEADNVQVLEYDLHAQRQIKSLLLKEKGNIGVITLGCRGTEFVLKLKAEVPIVSVDTNKRIEESCKILAGFSQKDLYTGIIFSLNLGNVYHPPELIEQSVI